MIASATASTAAIHASWRTDRSCHAATPTIVQTAMTAGLPYTALRDAILVHPTMAEGLAALFRAVPARR